MLIVIDTTETFQHPLLMSPDWSYVQSLLNRDIATLVVPEIVISETINCFPGKLTDVLSITHRAIGRLKKLVPNVEVTPPKLDVAEATVQFRKALSARLRELRAQTPGFKEIEINCIVQRSLQRRKPFDANGQRGLRDAILWETVLELARTKEDEEIVLVTGNTNDFGPNDGLDSDLIDDLENLNIAKDRIRICAGLRKFVESHVKPTLSKLEDLQIQIQEKTFENFDVEDLFADAYDEITLAVKDCVRQWGFQELGYIHRSWFESPRVININASPEDYEVGEVYRIADEEIAFSIVFAIKGSIECDEINDSDTMERQWSTEFVGEATFAVETSQVMEESTGQVTEFKIESVDILPGIQWPYDEID